MNLYSKSVCSVIMPWVSIFTRSHFWRLYRQFRKSPPDLIYSPSSEVILQKLQALIKHTYNHVPFYRERLDGLGLTPDSFTTLDDFQRLPPTTKADITANFPDRITASHQDFKPWRYVSSSGTTQRMTVIQDFRKRDMSRAALLLALNLPAGYELGMKYMEIPPDICTNVCGASDTLEPNIFHYFFENLKARQLSDPEVISDLRGLIERQLCYRQVQLPSFSAEGLLQKPESLDQYLRSIDQYRPYVLKAMPIYLYLLALHIRSRNLKPPRIEGGIMPMGASMTPYMRQTVESAFGCQVHDTYGTAELGGIGAECGHQNGIHPFSNLFHIEVVRYGTTVNGDELGKLLITDLWNYAMPLIRYDIGDVARLQKGRCKCGITSDRIELQGRVQDCLIGKDGTVLTSDWLTDLILKRPDVIGFQLELRDEKQLNLQVVPRHSDPPNLQEICQMLSKVLGRDYRISARIVPTIIPEPSGKFRFVKNLSKEAAGIF